MFIWTSEFSDNRSWNASVKKASNKCVVRQCRGTSVS